MATKNIKKNTNTAVPAIRDGAAQIAELRSSMTLSNITEDELRRAKNNVKIEILDHKSDILNAANERIYNLYVDAAVSVERYARLVSLELAEVQKSGALEKAGYKTLKEYGEAIKIEGSKLYQYARAGETYTNPDMPEQLKRLSPSNLDALNSLIDGKYSDTYRETVLEDARNGKFDTMTQKQLRAYADEKKAAVEPAKPVDMWYAYSMRVIGEGTERRERYDYFDDNGGIATRDKGQPLPENLHKAPLKDFPDYLKGLGYEYHALPDMTTIKVKHDPKTGTSKEVTVKHKRGLLVEDSIYPTIVFFAKVPAPKKEKSKPKTAAEKYQDAIAESRAKIEAEKADIEKRAKIEVLRNMGIDLPADLAEYAAANDI